MISDSAERDFKLCNTPIAAAAVAASAIAIAFSPVTTWHLNGMVLEHIINFDYTTKPRSIAATYAGSSFLTTLEGPDRKDVLAETAFKQVALTELTS